MTTINDGGPAFPVADENQGWGSPGMSLRDWFAGQALAGLLADPATSPDHSLVARVCYNYADAMLAARAKGGAE